MNEILAKQMAADYCCTIEEVCDGNSHYTVYAPRPDRRRFEENAECPLKVAVINGKLLFTGREDIIEDCRKTYGNASGEWFLHAGIPMGLQKKLKEYGVGIKQTHPFYAAYKQTPRKSILPEGVVMKMFEQDEILQFEEDDRFDEAFAFCKETPDVLGIAAVKDGEIIGMAGASADSPYLWQIGINVSPEASGMHIGTCLVEEIKNEILNRGKIPYYGTASSHIASQRVALAAGFLPEWVEMITEK